MSIKKEENLLSTSIGTTINAVRRERNYLLKELAEKAEISVTHLHQIENNLKKPSVEVFDKICGALETPSYLLLLKAKLELELVEGGDENANVSIYELKPSVEKFMKLFLKKRG